MCKQINDAWNTQLFVWLRSSKFLLLTISNCCGGSHNKVAFGTLLRWVMWIVITFWPFNVLQKLKVLYYIKQSAKCKKCKPLQSTLEDLLVQINKYKVWIFYISTFWISNVGLKTRHLSCIYGSSGSKVDNGISIVAIGYMVLSTNKIS